MTAKSSANCRYGPSTVYLYAYGLREGDTARLDGRNYAGDWLWIRPQGLNWNCWVAASTMEANVDIQEVKVVYTTLYSNPAVPKPSGVSASRSGDKVTITWNPVPPALEQGYLIEARICTNGYLIDVAYSTTNTAMTLSDEQSCAGDSRGELRAYDKRGYSAPVTIPWP